MERCFVFCDEHMILHALGNVHVAMHTLAALHIHIAYYDVDSNWGTRGMGTCSQITISIRHIYHWCNYKSVVSARSGQSGAKSANYDKHTMSISLV